MQNGIFDRSELLMGADVMEQMAQKRVIVFGVGGVGSWCAEALVRTGIRHITIVDADTVCVTNINRQLMATTRTVGCVKVEVLKDRLLEISPEADVTALQTVYDDETADNFHLEDYDYIIDAIDSLRDKMLLIERATRTKSKFFSSMGAALKMDPTKIEVAEFWKVRGCPLGAALRQRFRKMKRRPARKFLCVFSEELLSNRGAAEACMADGSMTFRKVQTNGSLAPVTGIFGFTLAGLVIKDIYRRALEQEI